MSNLESLRNELSLSLGTREAGEEFKKLLACHRELGDFSCFNEIVTFLHDPSEDYDLKDAVLLSMIRAYQKGRNSGFLSSALMLAMWPSLNQMVSERTKKAFFYEDLLSDVQDAFFQALSVYPVKNRPRKVALNLKMETLRGLCGHFRELNLRREAEDEYRRICADVYLLFPEKSHQLPVPARYEITPLEWNNSNKKAARGLLDMLVSEAAITPDEAELIFATKVKGQPLSEYASKIGVDYELLKKRRQRAEKRAVSFLKKIFFSNLSHLPENRTVHLRGPESPEDDS